MSCKIEVEHNSEWAGDRSYFISTIDAASLETRIAAIDTCLNPQGIDPMLYDLYREGSPLGEDMHTASSFSVFGEKVGKQVYEAEDENGKVWKYIDETKLHIMRDGKEMDVLGSEILETDSIIEYTDLMK